MLCRSFSLSSQVYKGELNAVVDVWVVGGV